jgi:anhydro-N-acetylmuramic acid kinase
MALFIGAMSGTSLDGVDAVLVETALDDPQAALHERAFVHHDMPEALRAELLALNGARGADELHRAALAANAVARLYAEAAAHLLEVAKVAPSDVLAFGAHGQTVRHRPGEFDGSGYTVQLLNAALLAEASGIDVVADLRSRDVAAGGQGAPLVPAFHAACFGEPGRDTAVLNLGGIGNLTLLAADRGVRGFDCGPGNVLMDLWCRERLGLGHDAGGAMASRGRVDAGLLGAALADPYFARQPPKSTGRDLFDWAWLARWAAGSSAPLRDEDALATLAELTARAAIDDLRRHAPGTTRLRVCGGGAFNAYLLSRLAALAGTGVVVESTAAAGIAPDKVEALAFAWLAREFSARRPGNVPAVTGAAGPRVLGALYPR